MGCRLLKQGLIHVIIYFSHFFRILTFFFNFFSHCFCFTLPFNSLELNFCNFDTFCVCLMESGSLTPTFLFQKKVKSISLLRQHLNVMNFFRSTNKALLMYSQFVSRDMLYLFTIIKHLIILTSRSQNSYIFPSRFSIYVSKQLSNQPNWKKIIVPPITTIKIYILNANYS